MKIFLQAPEVNIKLVWKYKNVYMHEVFTDKMWISLVAMQALNLIVSVQSQQNNVRAN